MMSSVREPSQKLLDFIKAYPEHVQKNALSLRELILKKAPNSFELIYDSYNALSTAFSFTENLNEAFCHIALYSQHVNLGFNYGSELEDPNGVLGGSGKYIRHLKIKKAEDLEAPHVNKIIQEAICHIHLKFPHTDQSSDAKAIVKSISDNKRRPK